MDVIQACEAYKHARDAKISVWVGDPLARDGDWHAVLYSSRTEHRQLGAAARGQAERCGSTHPNCLQPLSRLVAAASPPSPLAAPICAVIPPFQPFSAARSLFSRGARGACARLEFMHSHNTINTY